MKRLRIPELNGPLADVLPPGFEPEFEFFPLERGATVAINVTSFAGEHTDLLHNKTAPYENILADAFEASVEPDLSHLPGATTPVVETADERLPADLSALAGPLKKFGIEFQDDDTDHDHSHEGDQILLGDAAVKPSWAGGGKGKDKGDGGTDSGTDTGGTDGGADGGTDTGETNPGSTDPNVYVSGMDNPEGYNIELVFQGSWSETHKQFMANVAERISDIITHDLPNHNGIDDIRLTLVQSGIDGSGGAWATGGPRSLRSDSLLPSTGVLTIDTEDMGKMDKYGLWEDLGLHEMLHAMGFGTLFDDMGLVKNIDGQQRFTGSNAIEAYNTEFADIASGDALSNQGVRLDYGAHWHHGTFGKEVMTSTLSASGNYLSDMSIAALEDLGYQTIYNDPVDMA